MLPLSSIIFLVILVILVIIETRAGNGDENEEFYKYPYTANKKKPSRSSSDMEYNSDYVLENGNINHIKDHMRKMKQQNYHNVKGV